ncbi:hypothetical protein KVE52_01750 [Helicobacter pylori]|nr:hypothetical protein [Helicobacter pylori]WRC07996.1 hypothetical protein KVE52_01750 [Helicobacter pylori]
MNKKIDNKKLDWDDKTLRELETIAALSNHYRDGINYSVSNLNGIRSYHKRA